MTGDIDINAGTVIDGTQSLEEVGQSIFNEIIEAASGKWVKAEKNGHREFTIWSEQGISL
jgi:altronate dehydratase